jgi:hypothetical protein
VVFDVVKVNLQRVVSIPGFIACVHDAMTTHTDKRVRTTAWCGRSSARSSPPASTC